MSERDKMDGLPWVVLVWMSALTILAVSAHARLDALEAAVGIEKEAGDAD